MKSRIQVLCAFALLTFLMASCHRTPETPKVETSATSSPASSGQSVALPQSKVPQSDAAIPVAPGATAHGSGDANSATQANPTELQKNHEQAGMPMSGQVNNHSVPETGGQQK